MGANERKKDLIKKRKTCLFASIRYLYCDLQLLGKGDELNLTMRSSVNRLKSNISSEGICRTEFNTRSFDSTELHIVRYYV